MALRKSSNTASFGQYIRELRMSCGLTANAAAHEVGITRTSWRRYEIDAIRNPKREVLFSIAHRFNVNIDELTRRLGSAAVADPEGEVRRRAVDDVLAMLADQPIPRVLAMRGILRAILDLPNSQGSARLPELPPDLGNMPVKLEPRVDISPEDRAIAAEMRDGDLWLTLADGRRLGVPLEHFGGLADADPAKLDSVELEEDGTIVYFPELPEWIYVPALLGYPPD